MKTYKALITPKDGVEADENQVGLIKLDMTFTVGDNTRKTRSPWSRSDDQPLALTAGDVVQEFLVANHLYYLMDYEVTEI